MGACFLNCDLGCLNSAFAFHCCPNRFGSPAGKTRRRCSGCAKKGKEKRTKTLCVECDLPYSMDFLQTVSFLNSSSKLKEITSNCS